MIYDPGRDAAERHESWVIRHRVDLGVPEVMCPVRKVILIERNHLHAERRCSLAHAVAHIDLDHAASRGLTARQECAADRLAARRLIGIHHLAEAWLWSESFEEVAAEVMVAPRFLKVRLLHLHPSERHYLRRRIATKELSA